MTENEKKLKRLLNYEQHCRIGLQIQLAENKELFKEIKQIVHWILDCPYTADAATIPKAGIEARPEQVVLEVSMGYLKRKKLIELAERLAT